MDWKDNKLDYEKPKLEDMSRDRTSGPQAPCETGSSAMDCTNGTAAVPTNGGGCSVGDGVSGPVV